MEKTVLGSYSARGKEKPQEHQEVDAKIAADRRPNDAPAHPVGRRRLPLCRLRLWQRVLPLAVLRQRVWRC